MLQLGGSVSCAGHEQNFVHLMLSATTICAVTDWGLPAGALPAISRLLECILTYQLWLQGYFYYIFGFCFIVGLLTVIITVEVSIVCTYVQLCAEDYLWW